MSGGHKTSAVPRPTTTVRRAAGTETGARLRDFTRPIADGKKLVRTPRRRRMLGALGMVVIAAMLGALFVLPVQAWLRQEDDLAVKRAELGVLEDANADLEAEVEHLQSEEGAKEAARDELGLVEPGEIRISMLDVDAPAQLPSGWPYDAVTQIVATRAALRDAAPATTAPATTTTSPP